MKTAGNMISNIKWNLGNKSCPHKPSFDLSNKLTYRQQKNYVFEQMVQKKAQENTIILLISKLRVFTSLFQPHLQPKSRKRRQVAGAWGREEWARRESGPVLTIVKHLKWLTYLGWGGMVDSAWYECTCWFARLWIWVPSLERVHNMYRNWLKVNVKWLCIQWTWVDDSNELGRTYC